MPLNSFNNDSHLFPEQPFQKNSNNVSLGSNAENVAGSVVDPFGHVGGFYNDIMGFSKQERDQQFQEYMQEKQWAYDHPVAQMERMKEAGINPNISAGGIAGGNHSASAPSPSGAAGSSAPMDLANAVTGGNLRLAEASNQKAQANLANKNAAQVDKLADSIVMERAGSFAKMLTDSGAAEIASTAMALSLFSGGLGSVLALFKGDDICRRINIQNQLLDQEYHQGVERFEQEKKLWPAQVSIEESRAREQSWNENLAKFKQEIEQKRAELYKAYEGLPEWDIWQQQLYFLDKYGPDSPQYKSLFNIKEEFAYRESVGMNKADVEYTYEKFQEQYRAEEINKRASNAYELFQRATISNGGYSWFNRVTGIAFDGSIKEYRAFLDSQIDALADKMEAASPSDRDLYLKLYDELVYARGLPKRALMNYLNDMKKRSSQ